MKWRNKIIFVFFLISYGLELYSKVTSDTIQKSHSKLSIELNQSPFSLMKYSFPNYKNLNPSNSGCTKCAEEEKHNYLSYLYLDNINIVTRYNISKKIVLKLGIRHIHEEIPTGNFNYNYAGDTLTINSIGYVRNRYFGIPLSITLRTSNTKLEKSYTVIEAGFTFDMVYYEKQSNGSESVNYLITPTTGSPYYQSISRIDKPINPRENKFNFNRLSPFAKIYFEWLNKPKTISFILGSAIEFKSLYQLNNTAEFYQGYKITPVFIGFVYHLK